MISSGARDGGVPGGGGALGKGTCAMENAFSSASPVNSCRAIGCSVHGPAPTDNTGGADGTVAESFEGVTMGSSLVDAIFMSFGDRPCRGNVIKRIFW